LKALWRFIDRIFDFRFKRYLTPYLIRAWWAWLVFCCFAGYFIYLYVVPVTGLIVAQVNQERAARLLSGAGQQRVPLPSVGVEEEQRRFSRNAHVLPDASQPKGTGAAFGTWLLLNIGYIFSCGCFLICARILAELVMVIFNISSDLKEAKRRFEEQYTGG
jgi:hypothetical protein